jgi:glutathione S-transferase
MSNSQYELLYFPVRGRAEQIRLTFAMAQVPFTDTAVTDWPGGLKSSTPTGQLPVLRVRSEAGESQIAQSLAIIRHLARQFDLYGANEQQRTQCDVLADTANDWRDKWVRVAFARMMNTPVETIEKYWHDLPGTLALFEKLHGQSAAPQAGWFVGDKPTFADVVLFDILDEHVAVRPELLVDYPGLAGFVARFKALPGIAARLAARQ